MRARAFADVLLVSKDGVDRRVVTMHVFRCPRTGDYLLAPVRWLDLIPGRSDRDAQYLGAINWPLSNIEVTSKVTRQIARDGIAVLSVKEFLYPPVRDT